MLQGNGAFSLSVPAHFLLTNIARSADQEMQHTMYIHSGIHSSGTAELHHAASSCAQSVTSEMRLHFYYHFNLIDLDWKRIQTGMLLVT